MTNAIAGGAVARKSGFLFKRDEGEGDYFIRSEKRSSGGSSHSPKEPREGRDVAGFFYALLAVLLLALLFPVGCVLLWRRRLRWSAGFKLAATLVGGFAFYLLCMWLLLVPVENPELKAAQDKAIQAVDIARDAIVDAYQMTERNYNAFAKDAPKIAYYALKPVHKITVESLNAVMDFRAGLLGEEREQVVVTPKPTSTPSPTPTPEPTPTPTPASTPTVNPALLPRIKPLGESTVWYTGDGRFYHRASTCRNMESASPHTLQEALDRNLEQCSTCLPPPRAMMSAWLPVWFNDDGTKRFHITDECPELGEQWTVYPLNGVKEMDGVPCEVCGAYHFVNGLPFYDESTLATSSHAPTPSPTPETVDGNTIVYTADKGLNYHRNATCGLFTGMEPITLDEAIDRVLLPCPLCAPPILAEAE